MTWTDQQRALLRLSALEGINSATLISLIEDFGGAHELLSASLVELRARGVSDRLIRVLHSSEALRTAESEISLLEKYEGRITPLFWGEKEYPSHLASCVDAPPVLYVRGTIPQAPMVSVVGTRRMTPYSEDVLRHIFSEWARLCPDLVIVSGLAYGVDCCAHTLALEYNLRSVAVVAHGHYTLYPSSHRELAERMVATGGGIVTEYLFHTRALPHRFVARNRIVAGISHGTLVVESPEKGGALITANIAFDYSRALFAVPGRLFDINSQGCHKLIAINKASIADKPDRMLSEMGIAYSVEEQLRLPLTYDDVSQEDDTPLVRLLKSVDEISIEDLVARLGDPLSLISAQLFDLELDGHLHSLPGGRYRWRRN